MQRIYDLEGRTEKFAERIVQFAKSIPKNIVTTPIISQLVKAGTSIGANYCEADDAESSDDFVHKLSICKKEARETKYWLRLIMATVPDPMNEAEKLYNEAKELHLIFNSIVHKIKSKSEGDRDI